MNRIFIQVGSLTIYWYSVLILSAVLIGYKIIINYCKKVNYQSSLISDMLFYIQ